jgi:hypothetical protein
MAEPINAPRDSGGRPLYVEGYFSDRTWKGEQPDYGYPPNHVPHATIAKMKIETGYMTALKTKKAA